MVLSTSAQRGSAASLVQILWLTVLFFAIKGNALGLLKVSKLAIVIQLTVGFGMLIWVANDPVAQSIFGDPLTFGLGIGIPTAAWLWLYLWARQKVAAEGQLQNSSSDISNAQGLPEGNSGQQNIRSHNVDDKIVIHKDHITLDYQIIREPSVRELELEVKSYMLQGYWLVGGPFPLIEDSQHWVCQAIQRHKTQ